MLLDIDEFVAAAPTPPSTTRTLMMIDEVNRIPFPSLSLVDVLVALVYRLLSSYTSYTSYSIAIQAVVMEGK